VEALIRWNHPTFGILEPSSFISMAERTDIIVALDSWVLDETCRQARVWLDEGLPPLRVSSTWPPGTCPTRNCSTTSTAP